MTLNKRCGVCRQTWESPIGPDDYVPFLPEIKDCWCMLCMEVRYSLSLNSGHEHRTQVETNVTRLEALKIGWHIFRAKSEYLALQPIPDPAYPRGCIGMPMHSTEEPGRFRSRCGIGFGSL